MEEMVVPLVAVEWEQMEAVLPEPKVEQVQAPISVGH
jgi:hypothetical protein